MLLIKQTAAFLIRLYIMNELMDQREFTLNFCMLIQNVIDDVRIFGWE